MDPLLFIFLLSILLNVLRIYIQNHSVKIPRALVRIKEGIEKGKPNRRLWNTLRAQPRFDDHYRRIPGRMTCTVLPLNVNKEDVWQLRVGFKNSAAEKPTNYISIPVYANGHIYDV
ncbi:MAG: hypothetical protein CMI60_08165 [Parvibaculum sp.]|nr:hypothetical protein [Parvibaculum sp.]